MSDYIKREDAIKTLEGWKISGEMILATVPSADVVDGDKAQKEIDYWHDKAQSYEQTIVKLTLNQADVVEVVRCKDCKYGEVDNADFPNQYFCNHHGCDWNEGNHYCSYGERAEA